jgi:hypothetical protein
MEMSLCCVEAAFVKISLFLFSDTSHRWVERGITLLGDTYFSATATLLP